MSIAKILSASIQDFMRIELLELELDGQVQEITGENEAGKSSVLDAFEAALGGKRHDPQEPIRRGAEKARVVLDLGDLIVERVWTKKTDRLVVKSKDGGKYGQAKLDELVGGLAFDPMAFLSMKDAEQRSTLLGLCGVDLDAIENRRSSAFEERRDVGRDLKAAKARFEGAPDAVEGTPEEEVSISDLSDQLTAEMAIAEENRNIRRQSYEVGEARDAVWKAQSEWLDEIKHCEELLENAKTAEVDAKKEAKKADKKAKRALDEASNLEEPDIDATRQRMADAYSINAEVRKRSDKRILQDIAVQLQNDHNEWQEKLDEIAAEKAALLEAAEMPVEGLAITDDGVTFEDLPLSQASMSRRIRVCTAIGAALNPKLQIALVRSGNDLSDKTLVEFYSYCAEHDLQAVVERISGITEGAIVIEEGKVAK